MVNPPGSEEIPHGNHQCSRWVLTIFPVFSDAVPIWFLASMSTSHWSIGPSHLHLIGVRCCKRWSNCPLNTALCRLLLQLALAQWGPFFLKGSGIWIYHSWGLRWEYIVIIQWKFSDSWDDWFLLMICSCGVIHAKTRSEIPTALVQ